MTPQEIFDIVAKGLIAQGCAAVDEQNICEYRVEANGHKCAVGHLLPDNRYTPRMEGHAFDYDWIEAFDLQDLFPSELFDLLRELQMAHDTLLREDGLAFWKKEMQAIALKFDLDPQQVL